MSETKWRKILYEDQGVPDNYVGENFLDGLQKNVHIRIYNFWSVVKASGVVTQQLCSVCLFVVLFLYMEEGRLSPEALLTGTAISTLIGYVLHIALRAASTRSFRDDVRTLVLFVTSGYALSPLLMTLTETISSDTLYLMTFFMLLANLLFHDYGANAAMVSQSLSFNAAMFASVCLASRLPSALHTFTTLTCALQVFALWPVLRTTIKSRAECAYIGLTTSLAVLSTAALLTLSLPGAVMFAALVFFITFVCPAWLIHLQPIKNTIHGPWDEAVIKD